MPEPNDLLSEEQIRNYHATLSIALPRLDEHYTGKMMNIPATGNEEPAKMYRILNFNIIPIEKGGSKMTTMTNIDTILQNKNITDLVIMVRYSDYRGNEGLAEINSFLSANKIKKL